MPLAGAPSLVDFGGKPRTHIRGVQCSALIQSRLFDDQILGRRFTILAVNKFKLNFLAFI